ncbi:hypothetical protein SAMN02745831_06183 [Streptomyces sp. PgraA7]|nr:hypothetical protein SAMN02745831_06183 [Streptomyces sp. PgraA7]
MHPCPSCRTRSRSTGQYLCPACWSSLPLSTRSALSRRDATALTRLRELHGHLDRGVPLAEITVTGADGG